MSKNMGRIVVVASLVILVNIILIRAIMSPDGDTAGGTPGGTPESNDASTPEVTTPATGTQPSAPSSTDKPEGTQIPPSGTGTVTLPATQTPSPTDKPLIATPGLTPVTPAPATQPTAGVPAAAAARGLTQPPTTPFAYGKFRSAIVPVPAKLEKKLADCRSGILVDVASRRILWEKQSEVPYAIASMSKIMTAYEMICELSQSQGKIGLETKVQVPRHLHGKFADCHIYMDPRESFTYDELLKCMMIHSANDCAYLVGESLAGTESAFVERMNRRAKALQLTSFDFCNTNGLPDRKNKRANRGNARDMAYLAEYVMNIPEVMKWAGTKSDAIRENTKKPFALYSKNKLLGSRECPGINGLKTGYIDSSGYCIVVTCERNGRKMICVIMGSPKGKVRDDIVRNLLNWGYTIQ